MIETATEPANRAERDNWLRGWQRVVAEDGSTIAYCPDKVTARLIDAVPDLLTACHDALECAEHQRTTCCFEFVEATYERLRAALACATLAKARPTG